MANSNQKHGPNIKAWGPGYIPTDDASRIFGVSVRTLYKHKQNEELVFVKFEGVNYVTLASLRRYFGEDVVDFKLKGLTYNSVTGRYDGLDP